MGKNIRLIIIASLIIISISARVRSGMQTGSGEAENLLKEKYGKEFSVTHIQKRNGGAWYEADAYEESDPDTHFHVTVDSNGNMSDTYIQHCAAKEIDEKVNADIGLTDGYFLYSVCTTQDTISEDPKIGIENFNKQNPGNEIIIYIYYDSKKISSDTVRSAIRSVAKDNGSWRGYFVITTADEETQNKIKTFTRENDKMISEYKTETNSISIRYENGLIKE